VLEGFGLGCGVLWVGSGAVMAVGDMQRAEEEERGSWVLSSSSPPFFTARVGAEGAGVDRGEVHEHGDRVWVKKNSAAHSEIDFLRFLPARCSTQCPQEIQIRIFEIFHFG
jgi:hypothetical protein